MSSTPAPVFLSAEWRQLAMVNYEVDPAVLRLLVPAGTELDTFEGRSYVSLVGFLFLQTRVFGFRFPFHTNFAEVNLRFYVRRRMDGAEGWRRGTVFIKEMVPRRIIATMARLLYNESYITRPMRHTVGTTRAQYDWRQAGRWESLSVTGQEGNWQGIAVGSQEEFITEHYWGYNRQRDGRTLEYQVEHPRWRVRQAREYRFDCEVERLYGAAFVPSSDGRGIVGVPGGRIGGERTQRPPGHSPGVLMRSRPVAYRPCEVRRCSDGQREDSQDCRNRNQELVWTAEANHDCASLVARLETAFPP